MRGPAPRNLVLPSFEDTFERPPRSWPPRLGRFARLSAALLTALTGTAPRNVAQLNRNLDNDPMPTLEPSNSGAAAPHLHSEHESSMPRTFAVLGKRNLGCARIRRVVIIGVHGWFAQSILKSVMGPPIGTSQRFASMMERSVRRYFDAAGCPLDNDAVTVIAPQHDGCVLERADYFYNTITENQEWVDALQGADSIFIAAHSQGAIVADILLAKLLDIGVVRDSSRICVLSMCGIYHGPFTHLKGTVMSSYINYFETAAARELFDFQSSQTTVSRKHNAALSRILAAGVKIVHVGSIDDNVVPLYSALNSAASHPSILRALYVDGVAFPQNDFMIQLLTLCVAVRNGGFHDHNMITLLSASVAGSLYGGLGHALVYDSDLVYDLATRYLFETNSPRESGASAIPVVSNPFVAQRWNPYEIPWSLRGLLEDPAIRRFFADRITAVLADFGMWSPTSKPLKELQWRLSPIRTVQIHEPGGAKL